MSISNIEVMPICGTAVSLDICDSTNKFEKISESSGGSFNLYRVVDKVQKVILYALSGTAGHLVRFTGDGALIFFEEPIGISSTELAIEFGINFLDIWSKCCVWFQELKGIKFRVCLDQGDVMTNPDGGLWSGLTLNCASKMQHPIKKWEENRIIISERVKNEIPENSIYRALFFETGTCKVGSNQIVLNNLDVGRCALASFDKRSELSKEVSEEKKPICMCVSGIGTDYTRMKVVLQSIKSQSYIPEYVIVATSMNNINLLKKELFPFEIEFLCEEQLKDINRAAVRNELMKKACALKNIKAICFCDGDTLISKNCLKIAYRLYEANPDCVFSMPRIEMDSELSGSEVEILGELFRKEAEFLKPVKYTYWSGQKEKEKKGVSNRLMFLGSYFLFVPMEICRNTGTWDENFVGWGEEDIDFTYRIYQQGHRLLMPNIDGFLGVHLKHGTGSDSEDFVKNAKYLLSKYPELKEARELLYELIGL